MDLYKILELESNASQIEIKKSYHRLIKIYHPDRNNTKEANERYQKIVSAYEILINDETRNEYLKMNNEEKTSFIDILIKVINNDISVDDFIKHNLNIDINTFNYLKNHFYNLIKLINVGELLNFIKNGIIPRKNNLINCSESDVEYYDETIAEYFYNLPISFQRINNLDIIIDFGINLFDISNNKRKIKLKRNINGKIESSTFVFNLTNPYVVFVGGGDSNGNDYGNLIIKLKLPNNFWWTDKFILIEQSMSLYEMIYGLDIQIELGNDNKINIINYVPSRDGYLIEISNSIKLSQKLAIKLYLNYEDSEEKNQILKYYFS
jgi:hypothetical protein